MEESKPEGDPCPKFINYGGKNYMSYNSIAGLGKELIVDTDGLSQYAWLPYESFFMFKFRLFYKGSDKGIGWSRDHAFFKWNTGPGNVPAMMPLETVFRGVDSLVNELNVKLGVQEDAYMNSTPVYWREAGMWDEVICDPKFIRDEQEDAKPWTLDNPMVEFDPNDENK